jgi:hypothetical protein
MTNSELVVDLRSTLRPTLESYRSFPVSGSFIITVARLRQGANAKRFPMQQSTTTVHRRASVSVRNIIRTSAIASVVLAASLAFAPSATAAPSGQSSAAAAVTGPIKHVQSGKYLDGSVSQGVRLNDYNGGTYQQWTLSEYGSGTRFRHVQSGKCLDGSVSQGVRLNDCNSGTYQQWTLSPSGSGFRVKHVQSGKCLDGSVSQGVRLNDCNSGTYQQWL